MKAIILILAIVCSCACTSGQIARAQAVADQAQARVVQAEQAVSLAQRAVDAAKQLADQIGNERAREVLAQADQALDIAVHAKDAASATAKAAQDGVAAAKAAQEAGGSSLDVILSALAGLVPGAGAAFLAIRKAVAAGRALRQTVTGIESAKSILASDAVVAIHQKLGEAQDEATKRVVWELRP